VWCGVVKLDADTTLCAAAVSPLACLLRRRSASVPRGEPGSRTKPAINTPTRGEIKSRTLSAERGAPGLVRARCCHGHRNAAQARDNYCSQVHGLLSVASCFGDRHFVGTHGRLPCSIHALHLSSVLARRLCPARHHHAAPCSQLPSAPAATVDHRTLD
jgi:hypothetical protein